MDKVGDSVEQLGDKIEEAGKKAKKSLAPFDEITKVSSTMADNATDASQNIGLAVPGAPNVTIGGNVNDNITPVLDGISKKLKELIAPLRDINFQPLLTQVSNLGESFSGLGKRISTDLEWVWNEILVPFAKWGIEEFAPASVELLSSAFKSLGEMLVPAIDGIKILWEYAKPAFEWLGNVAVGIIDSLRNQYGKMADVFSSRSTQIMEIFRNVGEVFRVVWGRVQPLLDDMLARFSEAFNRFGSWVSGFRKILIDAVRNATEIIAGALTGNWGRVMDGLKGVANVCIALINDMISAVVLGIYTVTRALNKLSFTVPEWVPGLGGRDFGFNIKPITAPKIPYLANGAVIPPNAPFMAVLGDQRHGTNIEAPLSTIQEAVAAVMSDFHAGNMAGHEATVAVLKEILEAVLGIEIGDSVIGEAYERYRRKMAIVKGGT
jgi:phage-related protein